MNKKLIIVGGANGVGKSTLAYKIRDEFGIDYLGADDIAMKMKKDHEHPDIKAGKEFFRLLDRYLSLDKSIIIESTLADKWQLFYNGLDNPVEVAVGEKEQLIVYDEYYYEVYKGLIR